MFTAIGVNVVLADDLGVFARIAARLRNNLVAAPGQVKPADVTLGQDGAEGLPDIAHRHAHGFGALTIDGDADFRLAEVEIALDEPEAAAFARLGQHLLDHAEQLVVAFLGLEYKFHRRVAARAGQGRRVEGKTLQPRLLIELLLDLRDHVDRRQAALFPGG